MKLIEVNALKEILDKIPARRIENADGRAYVLIRLSTVFEVIKRLPSAKPAPCEFCKHNNIADDRACLMCSAERRTDE